MAGAHTGMAGPQRVRVAGFGLWVALAALSGCASAPVGTEQERCGRYAPLVASAAREFGLDASLIAAIASIESRWNPDAESRAGARGLMQLMPDTARLVAKELKVGYQVNHLTEDPSYNVLLGRTYLKSMIDDLGAVPPALAAYNAGPGRARRWMRDNGDPRIDEETMVDWIESIPFDETRSYVQRVMEGEAVYRLRLGGTPVQPPPASRSAFAQPVVAPTTQP